MIFYRKPNDLMHFRLHEWIMKCGKRLQLCERAQHNGLQVRFLNDLLARKSSTIKRKVSSSSFSLNCDKCFYADGTLSIKVFSFVNLASKAPAFLTQPTNRSSAKNGKLLVHTLFWIARETRKNLCEDVFFMLAINDRSNRAGRLFEHLP